MDDTDLGERAGRPPLRRGPTTRHMLGIALLAMLAGCAQTSVVIVQTESTIGGPTTAPTESGTSTSPGQAAATVSAVEDWADDHRATTIGVAVLDRATGELALGRNATKPMFSASLAKLIVAVDVLQRGPTERPLTDRDREMVGRALGLSDDQAMNALWSGFDGVGAVSRVSAQFGLADTRPPGNKARWGETLVSARDVARLFDFVLTGMPAQERDFILNTLAGAPSRAVDGFDQAFGLAAVESAAAKSGWMCCQQGKITLNSAGVVDQRGQRHVVALLTSQPDSLGYPRARDELTDAAEAAFSELR